MTVSHERHSGWVVAGPLPASSPSASFGGRRATLLALALALLPIALSAQTRTSASNEIVWHWFGGCASGDSLVVDVQLDGKALYNTTLPICQVRRADIKPESQQRLLTFRFDAEARRFRTAERTTGMETIEGTIWETRGERQAIRLGVSFATEHRVLLNSVHLARTDAPARTERVRGLVITTRPVRRSRRTP